MSNEAVAAERRARNDQIPVVPSRVFALMIPRGETHSSSEFANVKFVCAVMVVSSAVVGSASANVAPDPPALL